MKRLIVILMSMLLLLAYPLTSALAEGEDIRTENDIDLNDWAVGAGNAPTVAIGADGENDGVYLYGEGDGQIVLYGYGKELPATSVMLDFTVDTSVMDYSSSPRLVFSFGQQNDEYFSISFAFGEGTYDAELSVGSERLAFDGMKYKEDGHIQFRVAKEEVQDYESGESFETWNFILGIQKSLAPKNDKYNLRKNLYDDESFASVAEALDEQIEAGGAYMTVSATCDSEARFGLTVKQASYFCFYDYTVLGNSFINTEALDYTEIEFSFARPENLTDFGGFVIERYKNGVLDKSFTITNSYANTFSDAYLKQNTDYKYVITALKTVSSTNRIACSTIAFKYEEYGAHTLQGHLWKLFVGIAIFIAACAIFVIAYVYFYDIKRLVKK